MIYPLNIATYNTQFSTNPQKIKDDVLALVQQGVFVICLQEIVHYDRSIFILDTLQKVLGSDWREISNLGKEKNNKGMGNSILWNEKKIKLETMQKIFLPKSKFLSIHELLFSLIAGGVLVPFQRRSVIGTFRLRGKRIRITNLHLDHNGGLYNRQKQLEYVLNCIRKDKKVDGEVICGDFNILDIRKNSEEYELQKRIIGSDFQDVTSNIAWTADIGNTKFKYGSFVNLLIRYIHIRRKLDFIWVKNMKSIKSKTLPLNASDHVPLIAFLKI
jgi:endonuclease/exonuclease/phosphatase family metal-dependent hydrolase